MVGLIPTKFVAGVTLDLSLAVSAYPAPTWSLTLYLRGPGAIDLPAQADGPVHQILATASITAAWASGQYWWTLRATDGVTVEDVDSGSVEISPNLAAAGSAFDGRSHARRVLDAIEAVIEGRAARDQQSYTIAGRTLQRTPIADLLMLRTRYRAEVAAEEARAFGRRRTFGRMIKAVMP